jgi:hypothetical protein
METLYGKCSLPELNKIRLNYFHRVSEGKGCFALDEMCELINLLVKHLPKSKDLDTLIRKTAWLTLLK